MQRLLLVVAGIVPTLALVIAAYFNSSGLALIGLSLLMFVPISLHLQRNTDKPQSMQTPIGPRPTLRRAA